MRKLFVRRVQSLSKNGGGMVKAKAAGDGRPKKEGQRGCKKEKARAGKRCSPDVWINKQDPKAKGWRSPDFQRNRDYMLL